MSSSERDPRQSLTTALTVYKVFRTRVLDAEAEHSEAVLLGIFATRRSAWRGLLGALVADRRWLRGWRYSVNEALLDRTWWEGGFLTERYID